MNNNLKRLTVITIFSCLLFANAFHCFADELKWLENDKEEIIKMAKEQDRFILLFVGNHDCPLCNISLQYFNDPSGKLRKIIDENYVTWFVSYYLPGPPWIQADLEPVSPYISDYESNKNAGERTNFPILAIINPDDPDEDFTSYWGTGARTIEELYNFISAPPDIMADQELTWHENKDKVFGLAKEQGKNIFKFVGRPTSPNSNNVMKQLTANPLKELLDDNFILWYSSDDSDVQIRALGDEPNRHTLPYITIIDPDDPTNILDVMWGDMDVEQLEEFIKSNTPVSNEIISSDNIVTVQDNLLYISNLTKDEHIQIFTLSGQQIAFTRKNDNSITIDASNFPRGVVVVHSSTGWSKKIIIL